jgi:hypothetical protein
MILNQEHFGVLTSAWKEDQDRFWDRGLAIFHPYICTQAVLRLRVATLGGEGEEYSVKLSRLIRECDSTPNAGRAAPINPSVHEAACWIEDTDGPCAEFS